MGKFLLYHTSLTLSWRRPLSYRNQSIDLHSKWMYWFLYDNGLRHERVKENEICINSKAPIFYLLMKISILILTKSGENLKLLWLETWRMILCYSSILLNSTTNSEVFSSRFPFLKWKLTMFYFKYVQILFALFVLTPLFETIASNFRQWV